MFLLLLSLALITSFPALVVAIQVLAAAVYRFLPTTGPNVSAETLQELTCAVVIPARDEGHVIEGTLDSLLPQLGSHDRLVVVADNCQDATVEKAQSRGVIVLERSEPHKIGKGWALAFGRDYLRDCPPDLLIMIDADTSVCSDFLYQSKVHAMDSDRPLQATYILSQTREREPVEHLSMFAFYVRNYLRPLGMKRLGLPCLLNGSGMILPWSIAESAPLAGGHLGEEYRLGIDLALQGQPPAFCPEALVIGDMPADLEVAGLQRRRWSHTQLAVMRSEIPRLVYDFLSHRRFSSLALACDLLVPPFTVLLPLIGLVTSACLVYSWVSSQSLPLVVAFSNIVLLAATLVLASTLHTLGHRHASVLLHIPKYLLRHVPHTLAYFRRPHTTWTKTPRQQKPRDSAQIHDEASEAAKVTPTRSSKRGDRLTRSVSRP